MPFPVGEGPPQTARPLGPSQQRGLQLHEAAPARLAPLAEKGAWSQLEDLADSVARQIRQRPLTAVAVAIVVGFAGAGGLSFRAGRIVLASAARHAARELLKQLL